MYCPNCGKTNSSEQKFCRGCGLQLDQIVQSLVKQLNSADSDKKPVNRQNNVDRWIKIIAVSTISLFVGAVLWAIIYTIIIVKGEVLSGSIFLAIILGLVAFGLLMLYRDSLDRRPSVQENSLPGEQATDTAKLLAEPHFEPVSSVIERTTELLTVDGKPKIPNDQ